MTGHPSDQEGGIYRERLARIEKWSENMDQRMNIVQTDLRAVRQTLDQISGGKMLVLGVLAVLGTLASVVIAVIAIFKALVRG